MNTHKIIAVVLAVAMLAFGGVAGANAEAVQLHKPTAVVSHPKAVSSVVRHPRLHRWIVTFHDGSVYRFTPCPEEDSTNCYWDAQKRGNHIGHSFVNLHGRIHYV